MTIKAVKTPTVAHIPPELQQLKTEKKRVASDIKRVYQKQDELKSSLKVKEHKKNGTNITINNIKRISTPHANNPILRLKNGIFKDGENQSFIKKQLYKDRYALERHAAAQAAGSATPEIRAQEALTMYQRTLSALNQDIHNSQNEINKSVKELQELFQKESAIERALKAHTSGAKGAKTTPSGSVTAAAGKALIEADQRKVDVFGAIYHTTSGYEGIRDLTLTLRDGSFSGDPDKAGDKLGGKVIREYEKRKGDNIFKNNKISKYDIKNEAVRIFQDIKIYENLFYNTEGKKTINTCRGEYMTQAGINELYQRFKKQPDAVYELGQFYSTSTNQQFVKNLVHNDPEQGKVRVIFTLKGKSSRPVQPGNGLTFDGRENEFLYSPLACFRVTEIKPDGAIWRVSLQETVREKDKDRYIMPH